MITAGDGGVDDGCRVGRSGRLGRPLTRLIVAGGLPLSPRNQPRGWVDDRRRDSMPKLNCHRCYVLQPRL